MPYRREIVSRNAFAALLTTTAGDEFSMVGPRANAGVPMASRVELRGVSGGPQDHRVGKESPF